MTGPIASQVLETIHCPALKCDVLLLRDTWYGHILNPRAGHPYMKNKLDLLKRAVHETKNFFKFTRDPDAAWFADYECVDFKPGHDCLRVAFKRVADESVIIASAYRVQRGVVSYVPR